jgi:hypothetical protein
VDDPNILSKSLTITSTAGSDIPIAHTIFFFLKVSASLSTKMSDNGFNAKWADLPEALGGAKKISS